MNMLNLNNKNLWYSFVILQILLSLLYWFVIIQESESLRSIINFAEYYIYSYTIIFSIILFILIQTFNIDFELKLGYSIILVEILFIVSILITGIIAIKALWQYHNTIYLGWELLIEVYFLLVTNVIIILLSSIILFYFYLRKLKSKKINITFYFVSIIFITFIYCAYYFINYKIPI